LGLDAVKNKKIVKKKVIFIKKVFKKIVIFKIARNFLFIQNLHRRAIKWTN